MHLKCWQRGSVCNDRPPNADCRLSALSWLVVSVRPASTDTPVSDKIALSANVAADNGNDCVAAGQEHHDRADIDRTSNDRGADAGDLGEMIPAKPQPRMIAG